MQAGRQAGRSADVARQMNSTGTNTDHDTEPALQATMDSVRGAPSRRRQPIEQVSPRPQLTV